MPNDVQSVQRGTTAELPEGRPRTTQELAEAKLLTALQSRTGYVVVTGESSDAATTLFTTVAPRLTAYRSVRMTGRGLYAEAVVRALCVDADPATPPRLAMRRLIDEARAVGQPIVVAISEADAADTEQLERLRQTLEGAPDASEIVRIALLGGPKLVAILRRPEARAIAMRVTASVHVPAAIADLKPGRAPAAGTRIRVVPVVMGAAVLGAVVLLAMRSSDLLGLLGSSQPIEPPVAGPPPSAPALPVAPEPVAPPAPTPAVEAAPEATAAAGPVHEAPSPIHEAPAPAHEAPTPSPPPASPAPTAAASAPVTDATLAPARPVAPPAATEPPATARQDLVLQVGAFVRPEGAEALRAALARQFPGAYTSAIKRGNATYHRVRIAGFANEAELQTAMSKLRAAGQAPMRVRE